MDIAKKWTTQYMSRPYTDNMKKCALDNVILHGLMGFGVLELLFGENEASVAVNEILHCINDVLHFI